MLRIQDIDLREVFTKYLATTEILPDGSNRYKCLCPFHDDTTPSLVLYDNGDDGWAYHCFVCSAHGNAVTALVDAKYAATSEDAVKMLRTDFNLRLPDRVTVADLAHLKGLDPTVLTAEGVEDSPKGVRFPFRDEQGNIVNAKVRVSYTGSPKYYFEVGGRDQVPYGLHWLFEYDDALIYLTEGETDALTLRQAGFPVLGIGGSNGFKAEYAALLSRFKRVVVVRDMDKAGLRLVSDVSARLPNVYSLVLPTKDVNDFHVFKCGSKVEAFSDRFVKLPLVPATPEAFITAVNDGIIKATSQRAWEMVGEHYPSQADRLLYKEEFAKATKTPKTVVNQSLKTLMASQVASDPGFTVSNNCYVKTVLRDGVATQVPISNFILKPRMDLVADDGITRVVDLVSDVKVAHNVHLEPEELANPLRFNQKCLASGDYIFTGTPEDLHTLCFSIFRTPKQVVQSPRLIGRLPSGAWLLGNCGVDTDGQVVKPDQHGIITLDGTAYKPRAVTIDDDTSDMPMPDLALLAYDYPKDYLLTLARTFRDSFGTYGAWLGLGWVLAGLHSDAIFRELGAYPYLFVTGKRASGKSVFCTFLQQAYGFNPSSCGMSIESPTPVGILRYLSYRSSLPQWFDDYRNSSKRVQMKDSLLLDLYNRHGSVKGTRDGGVTQETVNGYILLSGEDTPANNAVATRCSIVNLSQYARNPVLLGELTELFRLLPTHLLGLMADDSEPVLRSIRDVRPLIGSDLRDTLNRGVFAGAFLHYLGDSITDKEHAAFMAYVRDSSTEQVADSTESHPMARFLNDFPDYGADLRDGVDWYIDTEGLFCFRLGAFHKAWSDFHRQPAMLSPTVLLNYLRQEPCYKGEGRRRFETVGQQRCHMLDLTEMTEDYPDFLGYIEERLGCSPVPVY